MDKLLIVDDEDIERDGMANLIEWEKHNIEIVGTAWNGLDGLEKIEKFRPNIVMVDVKMPVMNGIEMIQKARKLYPEIVFIILSGYGEYEFTSQAMEEGVRHYILKPCDEDKIISVIRKAQAELEEHRNNTVWQKNVRALLPRAKEQIFRDLMLGHDQFVTGSTHQLVMELGGSKRSIIVVAFRLEKEFDYIKQFVIDNVMNELLPADTLLLSTEIQEDVFLLVDASADKHLETAVKRMKEEFSHFATGIYPIYSVASDIGYIEELPDIYEQTEELLQWASLEKIEELLRCGRVGNLKNHAYHIFNYQMLHEAASYEQILFELHLAAMKMRMQCMDKDEMERSWRIAWKIFAGDTPAPQMTMESFADAMAVYKGIVMNDKEGHRNRNILLATYKHMNNPNISLQILAREELFMNEDYLGRVFTKITGMRFPAFVECRRIELAQQLLRFQSDLKISHLAEMVGYPADGQYFSKVFRKICGRTPSEYREQL